MKYIILIVLLLSIARSANAQTDEFLYADSVAKLPFLNLRATVSGYTFDPQINVSKDTLKKGFSVILKYGQFKVSSFCLSYECAQCDVVYQVIRGNSVTSVNFKLLRHIKNGESFFVNSIVVEAGSKLYRVPNFSIDITE